MSRTRRLAETRHGLDGVERQLGQRLQRLDQRVESVGDFREVVERDGQAERRGERAHLFGRQVTHEDEPGLASQQVGRRSTSDEILRATSLPSRLSETRRRFSTTMRPRRTVVTGQPWIAQPSQGL